MSNIKVNVILAIGLTSAFWILIWGIVNLGQDLAASDVKVSRHDKVSEQIEVPCTYWDGSEFIVKFHLWYNEGEKPVLSVNCSGHKTPEEQQRLKIEQEITRQLQTMSDVIEAKAQSETEARKEQNLIKCIIENMGIDSKLVQECK